MTIKQLKDGRYKVDCRPKGPEGGRVRKTLRTKNEAQAFERRIMGEAERGESGKKAKVDNRRVSDLVELWYTLHGQTLKTGESRKGLLLLMAERMGDPKAVDFSSSHFAQYRAERAEGMHWRYMKEDEPGRPTSANTLNHDLAYMRAVFNELIRLDEWALPNPLNHVRGLKFDETEMAYLDELQMDVLLTHLATLEDDTLLISEVCLATGARWGESEGLQPRQVRNRLIHFVKTKSSKNRTVPISDALYGRLRKALPFKPSYDAFRRAVFTVGLDLPPGQLTHVLRHTFASHYMMKGGDILTLQKVLGHATLAMTQKYAHFSPGHMKDVVNLNPMANRNGHFLDTLAFSAKIHAKKPEPKNDESHVIRGFEDGGPSRARTCDQRIMSPLL